MQQSKKLSNDGMTLVEVLIASAITIIIGLGIVGIQYMISQGQVASFKNYLNIDQTNSIVSTLVRELRNLRPADNGAYPLVEANDQEIIFYSDINFDGKAERVRYTLNGTQLIKGVIQPTGYPATYPTANEKVFTVTGNIRNGTDPIFYYYNGDWPTDTTNNPLPTPSRLSDTKLMQVHLQLNTQANDPRNDFILESYVQLRSLKTNL